MQFGNSEYSSNSQYVPKNQNFIPADRNQPQIDELFNEFKETNEDYIKADKFIEILKQSDTVNECNLLLQKLNKYKGKNINRQEFNDIFVFDFTKDNESFMMVFNLIDTNKTNAISLNELRQANEKYNLGLSEDEMDIMIKYVKQDQINNDAVTSQTLQQLLCLKQLNSN